MTLKRKGMTLIELMVVIAIMTILAAIFFPVFAQARDAARRTRCMSSLHQISMAHLMFVQDHDDVLPSWYLGSSAAGYTIWPQFLSAYYKDQKILDETSSSEKNSKPGWLADYSLCAWGPGGENTQENPYWRWPGSPMPTGNTLRPMVMADVQRPAETLQFTDGTTESYGTTIQRRHHNGMLIGAFLDGHARVVTNSEWDRVSKDERGYYYAVAAADR